MDHYPGELTLRLARERYFARAGFGEGGYSERWVRLKAGPLTLMFPNTAARVRSVRLHDLHHVLTEYDTSWTGEAEIAAWEVASGCADHYAAWILNFGALAIGLVIAPRRVYDAFVRGRRSANLYRAVFSEQLLDRRVGELRMELALGPNRPDRPDHAGADTAAFIIWSVVAVVVSLTPLLAVLVAVLILT